MMTKKAIGLVSLIALLALALPVRAQDGEGDPEPDGGTVLDLQVVSLDEGSSDPGTGDLSWVETVAPAVPLVAPAAPLESSAVGAAALAQTGGRSWLVGVRGGAYFDVDEPFLGAELLLPLTGRVWLNPNFEWVFVDRADLYSINVDLHYDLPTRGAYMFWLGAGLALTKFDPPGPFEGDFDPGLNLLAGLGFGRGGFVPYVQAKAIVDDNNTEFVLAGGFRF